MKIIELDKSHFDAILPLFYTKNYMGTDFHSNFAMPGIREIEKVYHKAFSNTYLSDLSRYKALGLQEEDGSISGLISFFISPNEPVWYGTMIRSANNKENVRILLDAAIEYNENQGRFRFYTLWSVRHSKLLRRFAFSDSANERYDYFDECIIPAKTKCIYHNFWTILFSRILLPTDTVVRCTYLKKEYRKETPIGGNL